MSSNVKCWNVSLYIDRKMKYKTLCSVLLLKGRGTNSVSQNLHAYYQPLCHQNEYKLDSYVILICLIMVK